MSGLDKWRSKIDEIDVKLVALLNERTEFALKIGKLKTESNQGIYSPDREKAVYERVEKLNKGPVTLETIQAIYREIMSGALSLEKKIKIAYLGPPATFTHQASIERFGHSLEHISIENITGVFQEVEKGSADYGVVPIENSIEGAVNHTIDMFMDSNLKICSEILLRISHNLLSTGSITSVKKIYSKAEVFGQCRQWLVKHLPNAEFVEVSSTTRAAEMVKEQKESAAIASSLAADLYDLNIISESIEDFGYNITRFLVISKNTAKMTGQDKTSIMFSIKDKVGALYEMLQPFRKWGINLTKIESRPSKKKAWDYYFFVDFSGHIDEENIQKALEELEEHCFFIKILGSYPVEKLERVVAEVIE
ncbi:MAG: prephenate dehydratase [Candidatus Theseobacter exili]|nr:prephenate dehydratase [Candidatus Theseobacter exili]